MIKKQIIKKQQKHGNIRKLHWSNRFTCGSPTKKISILYNNTKRRITRYFLCEIQPKSLQKRFYRKISRRGKGHKTNQSYTNNQRKNGLVNPGWKNMHRREFRKQPKFWISIYTKRFDRSQGIIPGFFIYLFCKNTTNYHQNPIKNYQYL